ncbi:MAG: protein-methionine-sulfoxide reductase catalytic subunit MsrP [Chromatiaceae bacterium]|nr:protein-methionine-sulfoxide reductase catalytic subunit MsrP [Chromatiaceae bacterium]MCP5440975.1 protein-methionine-sulfoxide reductase catalytic subunit MsrP [Chromatiaceae bacterium]
MLIKKPADIRPSEITDPADYAGRRAFLKTAAALGIGMVAGPAAALVKVPGRGTPMSGLVDTPYGDDLEPTGYEHVTGYNNFYEFGTGKEDPARNAHTLKTRPWNIVVDGECEAPGEIGIEDILKAFPQEERIYRLRCVEAWAMVVPWVGFPLGDLLTRFKPTSKANYVTFETLVDEQQMPGQRRAVLDWPYREGLRMDEAMHPLTILATGLYGELLPNQNGAPLRLVVPWKYGFKSIKSIVRISFSRTLPETTWWKRAPHEYGFYANVNPEVDHPRWSQARHRLIGEGLFSSKHRTLMFNGYADQVADLYRGMDLAKFY